jgi:hypothetical protein
VSFVRKQLTGVLKYDPFIKDFVIKSDGTGAEVHPVDQKVALLLALNLEKPGRITSAILETVTNNVRTCLQQPINAGDIELMDVQVTPSTNPTSRLFIGVFYKNLRLQTPSVQQVNVL